MSTSLPSTKIPLIIAFSFAILEQFRVIFNFVSARQAGWVRWIVICIRCNINPTQMIDGTEKPFHTQRDTTNLAIRNHQWSRCDLKLMVVHEMGRCISVSRMVVFKGIGVRQSRVLYGENVVLIDTMLDELFACSCLVGGLTTIWENNLLQHSSSGDIYLCFAEDFRTFLQKILQHTAIDYVNWITPFL